MIEHVPISITQVINETESLFQTSALDKNIQFTTYSDEYVENAFMGDPTRIMQVLNNLVSNAIKFTANNGTVSLSLKVTDNNPTTQVLEFCVADSGIGISDESLSEIFAPFVQANRLRDKTTPIIALSASVLKEDVEKSKLVGMNCHLAKPINRRELIKILQKFVKSKM